MLVKLPRISNIRVARRHRNKVILCQLLGLCLFALTIFTWVLIHVATNHTNITFPPRLQKANNVLLVLAHPDDESLFFGPTILQLAHRKPQSAIHLLFLSAGNHYGLGAKRKIEQKNSCRVFGVAADNCKVLDLPELQDDPVAVWPSDKIQTILADHVSKWHIDAIITFDEYGVSGHKNHIAASNGVVAFTKHTTLPLTAYTLTTTSIPRKYASLFDLPLTTLIHLWQRTFGAIDRNAGPPVLGVNSLGMWWHGVSAFQQHRTQNSWDRKLYAVLSRYMWFNGLREVEGGDAVD